MFRRPAPRTLFVAALVVLIAASVLLTHYAFTPSAVTRHRPDITPPLLLVPSVLALIVVQGIAYPSRGHRLAAGAVLLAGGVAFTLVVMFVLGCGFYGACSK